MENEMILEFDAKSENEFFARAVIGCFMLRLNPSVADIADVKTAVSEAVTNSIVHGYKKGEGKVKLYAKTDGNSIHINVFDKGIGIENLPKALEPFYTTKPEEERSGMGFTIMKSFMDEVLVTSKLGVGTEVYMKKTFNNCNKENNAWTRTITLPR